MAALRIALTAAALLVLAAPAGAAPPAVSGQLLVGFEDGVSRERQQRILATVDGRAARRFASVRGGRLAVVRPRSGRATDALLRRLRRIAGVAYAEPDFIHTASAPKTPDDPFYTLDYAIVESPEDHDIDAPEAWGTRTGCAKVAILDTGIDTDHPDLAANVPRSSDKPNNGKDDDKNGYVDDTYGWNAIKGKGSGQDDTGTGRTWPGSWPGAATTRTAARGSAGRPGWCR